MWIFDGFFIKIFVFRNLMIFLKNLIFLILFKKLLKMKNVRND